MLLEEEDYFEREKVLVQKLWLILEQFLVVHLHRTFHHLLLIPFFH